MQWTNSCHCLAVAALLALPVLAGCHGTRNDPGGLQAQLAGAIPLQSSEADVFAYLDRTKMQHSKYHRDDKSVDEAHGAKLGNVIDASVIVRSGHDLVDPSYDVVFRFNDQDQLIGYDVQWLGYIGL